MYKTKRLRIFAGPNGSGKSSLIEDVKKKFSTGVFVNSDLIEKEISEKGFINLEDFNLFLQQNDFDLFCASDSAKSLIKKFKELGYKIDIYVKENVIVHKSKETHSYEAALITSFIREKLYESNQSFSFETVMSHYSKLDEIKKANERGYRTYLYFICLDDPRLNISRVLDRMAKGGHSVDCEKITSRYYRTLEYLLPAISLTSRSYLFDNSANSMKLIAEANEGNITTCSDKQSLPNWFVNYVVKKL